jgi:hypothetical protein
MDTTDIALPFNSRNLVINILYTFHYINKDLIMNIYIYLFIDHKYKLQGITGIAFIIYSNKMVYYRLDKFDFLHKERL